MLSSRVEAAAPPPKRMRLGTKSCVECRRRKVRCIYLPNSKVCKECVLHDAQCTAQTPQHSRQVTDETSEDAMNMRKRLEELEGMVRSLCKAVDPDLDLSNPGKFERTAEALRRLRQGSTPEIRSESSYYGTASMDPSEAGVSNNAFSSTESFEDAPLLNLFKAAMLIEGNETQGDISRTSLTAHHRIRACITSLNALIPSLEDLTAILETTEKYWPLWNAFPKDVLPGSGHPQTSAVTRVRNFILDSMRSTCGVFVAKAVLCLALCIQQLPARFKDQRLNLPAPPRALLDSFLAGAETLLPVNEGSAGTLDGLECFGLQARIYIDMGRPRNAWLCLRRAMSYAILQGLHTLDDSADERRRTLWTHIWQHERQLSLILGLPPSISDVHPGVLRPHLTASVQERVMFEFSIIAGHIIERNQNCRSVDYSITERIEEELIQYRNGVASAVLDTTPTSSMPLETLYRLQVAKIYYHNHCKMLHLPYMLKASINRKYEHNRLAALEASRQIISAWQDLRDCCGSEIMIMCDLMDFQVFTAAIVLVINLLSPYCPDDGHQQARDWDLVHDISRNLDKVSQEMECNVAYQAARLLEHLSAAHHGMYEGPETYEATIPYFGRVRISQIRKVPQPPVEVAQLEGRKAHEKFSNMVEFSADSFVPFSQNYMGDYLTEAELGVDWTAVFNMDIDYDWSQSFDSSGFGMR